MTKAYSIAVPRYHIRGAKGEILDVFNKRSNAIKAATEMAVEYHGALFQVVKLVFHKETVIFSLKIDHKIDFSDLQDTYTGIIEAYQKRLLKTRFWRKL